MGLIATTILAGFAVSGAFTQAIETKEVEYRDGDAALQGYLAADSAKTGKRPGILIVHDWNSIDDYERGRARQLAEMGYVAFAADIYGKDVRPTTPKESGTQAGKYRGNVALFRSRLKAGLDQLKRDPRVDPSKIAVIGYCFGGTGALELARSGADVAGVVSFHGGLGTSNPEDAKNIKGKVLVCHGAEDPHVPAAEVQGFMKEMKEGGVDYQFIAYADAVHSFTEPGAGNDKSTGAAYNADADRRSWEHMKMFFQELFGS